MRPNLPPRSTTLVAAILLAVTPVFAQDDAKIANLAERNLEYSGEAVSLDGSTPVREALGVLSALSRESENKVIVNLSQGSAPIGIDIISVPWKKAFEMICRANGLTYKEFPDHYEVRAASALVKEGGSEAVIHADLREVIISATFFDADRKQINEVGIDWSANISSFSGLFELKTADAVSEGLFRVEGSDMVGNDLSIATTLAALESENLGEIIASPQVTVLSGKQGRIQVGTDFSIKTRDFAGNVIDNFFSTGTILTVEPVVIEASGVEFVHLKIDAERSSAIPDAVSTQIKKSQASTDVFLLDNEETVLAGLYSTDEQMVRKGIPFLKDLPWWFFGLRYLTGYTRNEVTEKELVIVLSAELVPKLSDRIQTTIEQARGEQVRRARSRLKTQQRSIREAVDLQNQAESAANEK